MMWNPWRRVRELTLELAIEAGLHREAENASLRLADDRDYWKSKAEILLDNALLRKGETASPVMAPPPAPSIEMTMGSVFGPLAVTEIETGKRRSSRGDAASTK